MPQVAVDLAQRTLGELEERSVLEIGAGETAELTARALAARGVHAIFIANRRYDRAIGLAQVASAAARCASRSCPRCLWMPTSWSRRPARRIT